MSTTTVLVWDVTWSDVLPKSQRRVCCCKIFLRSHRIQPCPTIAELSSSQLHHFRKEWCFYWPFFVNKSGSFVLSSVSQTAACNNLQLLIHVLKLPIRKLLILVDRTRKPYAPLQEWFLVSLQELKKKLWAVKSLVRDTDAETEIVSREATSHKTWTMAKPWHRVAAHHAAREHGTCRPFPDDILTLTGHFFFFCFGKRLDTC